MWLQRCGLEFVDLVLPHLRHNRLSAHLRYEVRPERKLAAPDSAIRPRRPERKLAVFRFRRSPRKNV